MLPISFHWRRSRSSGSKLLLYRIVFDEGAIQLALFSKSVSKLHVAVVEVWDRFAEGSNMDGRLQYPCLP